MSEVIAAKVEQNGWHPVHVVDTTGSAPGFSYSIGFERTFDHPEIIVFGLEKSTARNLLGAVADGLRGGARYEPYERLADVFGPDLQIEFRPVRDDAFRHYLAKAIDFYREPFRAWVLLWPDQKGRLPGEPECRITSQADALAIVAG
ncbi:MAG: DUF4262 domain-containing protein [Gammaproteobacteria bacterium]|nr:DUF4262 domain-containing protein [Gammaproteobacteria bacterium]